MALKTKNKAKNKKGRISEPILEMAKSMSFPKR
jgi:hypothetical protein